jgi:hypothetical protein
MRLFLDSFSGAQVASDAYPHEEIYAGAGIRFTAAFETKLESYAGLPEGEGDNNDGGDGETVINLADTYNLHPVEGITVKEWMAMVKLIMKASMKKFNSEGDKSEDEVKDFKKGCVEFVNFIKNNFDNIQLYQCDIGEYEGLEQSYGYAISENDDNPLELSFYFFRQTLIDEKY